MSNRERDEEKVFIVKKNDSYNLSDAIEHAREMLNELKCTTIRCFACGYFGYEHDDLFEETCSECGVDICSECIEDCNDNGKEEYEEGMVIVCMSCIENKKNKNLKSNGTTMVIIQRRQLDDTNEKPYQTRYLTDSLDKIVPMLNKNWNFGEKKVTQKMF